MMELRPLVCRKNRIEINLKAYMASFLKKRTPKTRVAVLGRMYKYFLCVPEYLSAKPSFLNCIRRKTMEFKKNPHTKKITPLFNAVLNRIKA